MAPFFLKSSILLLVTLVLVGCQGPVDPRVYKAQDFLQEATEQIDANSLIMAQSLAEKALITSQKVVEDDPINPQWRILRARTCLALFLAKNLPAYLETQEHAPYVISRIPLSYFIAYRQLVPLAQSDLLYALTYPEKLSLPQQALAHTLLADIYRLSATSAMQAEQEYTLAVELYRKHLNFFTLDSLSDQISSYRIREKIQEISYQQAILAIVDHDWQKGLELLQHTPPSDLKSLGEHLLAAKAQMLEMHEVFGSILPEKKPIRYYLRVPTFVSPIPDLFTTQQFALYQAEHDFTLAMRNLLLSLIYYHYLNDKEHYATGLAILQETDPSLAKEFSSLFVP